MSTQIETKIQENPTSMNGTEEFEEGLAVTIFETVLIGTVSAFGFMCNFLSFLILIRHKAFKNSFGYLTAYESLSNAFILLIFLLWATPWTLLEIPDEFHEFNLFIGQLSLLFVESSFHCNLLITINRLVAVLFPMFYRRMFSERITPLLLLAISFISLLYFAVYFMDGCSFYYDHQYRVWTFGVEQCSQRMAFYVDMCYNVSLFVVICGIDMVVFMHLRSATKKMMTLTGTAAEAHNKRRLKKESRLFIQSFLSSCMYAFMLLCFHLITRVISSGFGLFMCTTFIWGFSHAVGGLILICFNPEIRKHLVGIRHFLKFLKDPVSVSLVRHQQTLTMFTVSQK